MSKRGQSRNVSKICNINARELKPIQSPALHRCSNVTSKRTNSLASLLFVLATTPHHASEWEINQICSSMFSHARGTRRRIADSVKILQILTLLLLFYYNITKDVRGSQLTAVLSRERLVQLQLMNSTAQESTRNSSLLGNGLENLNTHRRPNPQLFLPLPLR